MDVVLGVAVTDRTARMVLVGGPAADGDVIDRASVPMPEAATPATGKFVGVFVGLARVLARKGHRLAAIGICWDDDAVTSVREQLRRMGFPTVAVIDEDAAAATLVSGLPGERTGATALVQLWEDVATLSVVDGDAVELIAACPLGDDRAAACAQLMADLDQRAVTAVVVVGERAASVTETDLLTRTTNLPVVVPEDAEMAMAFATARTAPKSVDVVAPVQNSAQVSASLLAALAKLAAAQQAKNAAASNAPAKVAAPKAAPPVLNGSGTHPTIKLVIGQQVTASKPAETNTQALSPATNGAALTNGHETNGVALSKGHHTNGHETNGVALSKVPHNGSVFGSATVTDAESDRATLPAIPVSAALPIEKPRAEPELPQRKRQPLLLVGSALSGVVMAGVVAFAVTGAIRVDPAAEDLPTVETSVPAPANPSPSAAAVDQQSELGPQVVVPEPQATLQGPQPAAAGGSVPQRVTTTSEPVYVPAPVAVTPEQTVAETVPEPLPEVAADEALPHGDPAAVPGPVMAPTETIPAAPAPVAPVAEAPVVEAPVVEAPTAPLPSESAAEVPHLPGA